MTPVEFSICMPHLMGLVLGGYMLQSYYIRCWSLIAEWDIAANGSKWYSMLLRKRKAREKKIKNLALKKRLLGFPVQITLISTTTVLNAVDCHSRIRLTSYKLYDQCCSSCNITTTANNKILWYIIQGQHQ